MVLLLVAGMVTFQKHATITRRRLFSDTEKKFQEIRRVQEQKEAGSMDSGVPPEFRGDWRRIGAARGGDGAVAEVHPDSKAKLQKEIEKMLSESSAAQVGVLLVFNGARRQGALDVCWHLSASISICSGLIRSVGFCQGLLVSLGV